MTEPPSQTQSGVLPEAVRAQLRRIQQIEITDMKYTGL